MSTEDATPTPMQEYVIREAMALTTSARRGRRVVTPESPFGLLIRAVVMDGVNVADDCDVKWAIAQATADWESREGG